MLKYEITVKIAGTTQILDNNIESATVYGSIFEKVSVGNTQARQLDLAFFPNSEIPRMAKIELFIRSSANDKEIPKGVFYIDTRSMDWETGLMTIHGFDAMLMMEQEMVPEGEPSGTWPRTPANVMEEIAERIGTTIDPRTKLNDSYLVDFPDTGATMRQTAGWIAGMHGGNWIISDAGLLRLIPLVQSEEPVDLKLSVESLHVFQAFQAWSGVTFYYGDEDLASAGDDAGRVLEIECPWANQKMADTIFGLIRGAAYQPFTATNAILDPTAEIGDMVLIDGYSNAIVSMSLSLDELCPADISAPGEENIDHEYPIPDHATTVARREANKVKASITVNQNSINLSVADELEELRSEIELLPGELTLYVEDATGEDGKRYAKITLRIKDGDEYRYTSGQILLEGNINVSGELSADALYATYGDMADLVVDRLSTSRRVVKYLKQDTSDDNYQSIAEEGHQYIAGICGAGEEQAVNPFGAPLYWEQEVMRDGALVEGVSLGSDGYPRDETGVRIFTTTKETPWPVMVYTYTEQIKASFAFEQEGQTQDGVPIYTPTITLGAGNQQGTNLAKIRKGTDGLSMLYQSNADGREVGIKGTTDGYLDLYGLRRTVTLDFSTWDSGSFSETVEGNAIVYSYSVTLTDGVPVAIAYEDGVSLNITW